MKAILLIILLSVCSVSFACEDPSDRFLRGMLHEGEVPTVWRTVKGKSHNADRSVKAVGVIGRTIESSYAVYKGKRHTAEGIVFCKTGSNKLRAIHPKHGSVHLTRTGTGKKSMLSAKWGIFGYNLRLDKYVIK